MTLDDLINRGFDRSTHDEEEGTLRPRCSQCETLVIQGVPCHETGCPNIQRTDFSGAAWDELNDNNEDNEP